MSPFMYIFLWREKAKIELSPAVSVIYNHDIKEQVMKKAINTCNNYREEFIEEWHKCFDD